MTKAMRLRLETSYQILDIINIIKKQMESIPLPRVIGRFTKINMHTGIIRQEKQITKKKLNS